MAMKARYTVIDGEVIAEKRSGVRKQYVPDPLGSTVALLDNTQTQTDTFAYWPYGEDADRTGTTPTPFQYVGTWGQYRDSNARDYVRVRELHKSYGRWSTQDPLYPFAPAYSYCLTNPSSYIDPSGLFTITRPGRTRPGRPCGSQAIMITPGAGDWVGVVIGKVIPGRGQAMLSGSDAIHTAFGRVGGGQVCIAVNGGYFTDVNYPNRPQYHAGEPSTPVGPVVDCFGNLHQRHDSYQYNMPVQMSAGFIFGHHPNKPGGVPRNKTQRTGACVDAGGNLTAIIAVGGSGLNWDGMVNCMNHACPTGTHPVMLDGGGSTQVIQSPNRPYSGFGGSHRPVNNWIVICQ